MSWLGWPFRSKRRWAGRWTLSARFIMERFISSSAGPLPRCVEYIWHCTVPRNLGTRQEHLLVVGALLAAPCRGVPTRLDLRFEQGAASSAPTTIERLLRNLVRLA